MEWVDLKEASKTLGIPASSLRRALNEADINGRQVPWGARQKWQLNTSDYPAILSKLKSEGETQRTPYKELFNQWEQAQRSGYLTGTPLKPTTIERNGYGLKAFWTALNKSPDIESITLENVRLAIGLVAPDKKSVRENIYMATKSLFKFMVTQGLRQRTDLALFSEFKPKRTKAPRRTFLKPGQFEELLLKNQTEINGRSQYDVLLTESIAMTFRYTGMRRSELLHLELDQVDFKQDIIHLETTKTGEPRQVGLNPALKTSMEKYLEARPKSKAKAFFLQATGRPLTKEVINHRIRAFGQRGDVPITPHGIRRFFITDLLAQGVAVSLVKKIVGHKHLATTDLYDMTTLEQTLDVLRGTKNTPAKKKKRTGKL